jgi:DNA polymerase V
MDRHLRVDRRCRHKDACKLANRIAKKDKKASGCITVLATADEQRIAMQQTRVDDLWGVGRAYAVKLINWGITSAWELSNMPEEWAHSHMGGVTGVRLIRELKGQTAIVMEEELVDKKMIATTRMFGRLVTDIGEIKEPSPPISPGPRKNYAGNKVRPA